MAYKGKTKAERLAMLKMSILDNPYIPSQPTKRQAHFLVTPQQEALYGGSAGGGKSEALLMGALQFVIFPRYSALLLRRTYGDLALPGAIMDRSFDWLMDTDAKWNANTKTWHFPPYDSTLTFGHLQHERNKYRYQSAEFQFIGIDELTQFTMTQYRYMMSRLRRTEGSDLPLRIRAATNPGGTGHRWVKERFNLPAGLSERPFIPARLPDNPHLDSKEYESTLNQLDPVLRAQLLNGDWNVAEGGYMFKREWFDVITNDKVPRPLDEVIRFWDLAASKDRKPDDDTALRSRTNPSFTAGVKMGIKAGIWYLLDVRRFRARPKGVEDKIASTASQDGVGVPVWLEEEGGSGGKYTLDNFRRRVLPGYIVKGRRPHMDKIKRAGIISSAAEAGNVKLVEGKWNESFLDEADLFPYDKIKDQIDALSGGSRVLKKERSGFLI